MLVLAAVAGMTNGAQAQDIEINDTNFPDVNFRTHVKQYDTDSDGFLGSDEIAAVTSINVSFQNIADLQGIEHFTALTRLNCFSNQLTELDVSKNTMLEILLCGNNQLTELDVSANTALTYLACNGNQLTALDVSANIKLANLGCYSNQIQANKMLALVNSLPTPKNGDFCVVNTQDSNEGNVITKSQVAIATGKNWRVMDYKGPVEYAGVEEYPLTLQFNAQGGMLRATPNGNVGVGTEVTLTPQPNTACYLKSLKAYKTGEPTTTVTITNKKFTMPDYGVTVEAEFAAIQLSQLTVVSPTNGTLTASPSGNVIVGKVVTLTATPAEGYKLKALKAYKTGEPSTTVTIAGNKFTMPDYGVTVEAEFEEETTIETNYPLTVVSPTNGTLTASPSGYISEGTEVTLTATPASGYKHKALKAYKTGEPSTTVAINGNKFNMPDYGVTVEAEFEEEATIETNYPLTVVSPTNGTITASPSGYISEGTEVTLTATPASGYKLKALKAYKTGEASTTVAINGNKFTMPAYEVTVEAEFEKTSSSGGSTTYYTLSYIAGEGGTIRGNATQSVAQGGSSTEVEAVPNSGYVFKKWSDGLTTAKRTDYNVQGNRTVTAEFEKSNTTGIFDTKLDALSVYPNPTQGVLWVSVPEFAEGTAAEVHVYNTAGQLLQRVPTRAASIGSAASPISIDLSSYPSGLYIVRVGNAVAKVVKQ